MKHYLDYILVVGVISLIVGLVIPIIPAVVVGMCCLGQALMLSAYFSDGDGGNG